MNYLECTAGAQVFEHLVGTMVLFALADGPRAGECRPALVIKAWQEGKTLFADLRIFSNGILDGERYRAGDIHERAVPYNDFGTPRTWRYRQATTAPLPVLAS